MGRTPTDARDTHGLGALPTGEIVRVTKVDDGRLDIRRDIDNAVWDGAGFVVPEPELCRYAVTMLIEAIDDPTARLRGPAAALGRGANLRLAGSVPAVEQGRRRAAREQRDHDPDRHVQPHAPPARTRMRASHTPS